jgi:hypothetical protein
MTQYVLAGNLGPALDIAPDQDCVRVPIERMARVAHQAPISGFGTFETCLSVSRGRP